MCDSVSGIDYQKVAPLVWYDGCCFQCARRFSRGYPLRLLNIAGDKMFFCSYECLEGYRKSLLDHA